MGIVFHPMTLVVLFSCKKNKTLATTIQIKKNHHPLQKSKETPNQQLPTLCSDYLYRFELLHPERSC